MEAWTRRRRLLIVMIGLAGRHAVHPVPHLGAGLRSGIVFRLIACSLSLDKLTKTIVGGGHTKHTALSSVTSQMSPPSWLQTRQKPQNDADFPSRTGAKQFSLLASSGAAPCIFPAAWRTCYFTAFNSPYSMAFLYEGTQGYSSRIPPPPPSSPII